MVTAARWTSGPTPEERLAALEPLEPVPVADAVPKR